MPNESKFVDSMPESIFTPFDPNGAPITNPAGVSPVYSNNASVLQLPHDFRIVFTELLADGPGSTPRVEMRASIALSPTMLKGLYFAIEKTLTNYESQSGEIKWPPQQPKIV